MNLYILGITLLFIIITIIVFSLLVFFGRQEKANDIENSFPEISDGEDPWKEYLMYETMKTNKIVQGNRLDNGDLRIRIEGNKDRIVSFEEVLRSYWDKR